MINFRRALAIGAVAIAAVAAGSVARADAERVASPPRGGASPGGGAPLRAVLPVCTGFDPLRRTWGPKNADVPTDSLCPPGHAFMSVRPVLGRHPEPGLVPVSGYCCPLPPDALGAEQSFHEELCPENSVATGAVKKVDDRFLLRCTVINSRRYSLGPRRPGRHIEPATELVSTLWGQATEKPIDGVRGRWPDLPLALRYGMSRLTRSTWDWELCYGEPPGALLCGKSGKHCSEHSFCELQERDTSPAGSTAVPPVPCDSLKDPFGENPVCE